MNWAHSLYFILISSLIFNHAFYLLPFQDIVFKIETNGVQEISCSALHQQTNMMSAHRAILCARSEIFQNMLLHYQQMSSPAHSNELATCPEQSSSDLSRVLSSFDPARSTLSYITLPQCSTRSTCAAAGFPFC